MENLEGVIKYELLHQHSALAAAIDITELNGWRSLLYKLQLIGQIPEKYAGLGFGNISRRLVPGQQKFLISGTQTGHLPKLTQADYALIVSSSPATNYIESTGLSRPSSESLTHASLYAQDPNIQAVIHVHSPELWHNTTRLQLPHTTADVPYGTPEMAVAVQSLFTSGDLAKVQVFSMLGHKDGIVAFGDSISSAAMHLLEQIAKTAGQPY